MLITTVHPDTGAEAAGLREGDVILEFAGLPILSVRHLQRLVSETPVGRTVEVGVLRAGQRRSFAGRVEERDAGRFGGLEGLGEFMRALPDLERLIPEFQQGQEPPGYHLARDSA